MCSPYPSGVALLAATLLLQCATGHFNLRRPAPYNRMECSPFTLPRCKPPCPAVMRFGGYLHAQNSPESPAATWRRGETVAIEWHRNNRDGGFYRRSLVPVAHMHDPYWHAVDAFEWGCWSQGVFVCRGARCGTDKRKFAHRNHMLVPPVFPNGDYVFAMVWFGGLHYQHQKALFPDYYTCSFVRIHGGSLWETFLPRFVPGFHRFRFSPPGTCASTSAFVDECGGQACFANAVRRGVPGMFEEGKTPEKVLLEKFWELGKVKLDSDKSRKASPNCVGSPKDEAENTEAAGLAPSLEPIPDPSTEPSPEIQVF